MFKEMTVGQKTGMGFLAVVIITICIGSLGVWNMLGAKTESDKLAQEYVPEVLVATNLLGAANRVMYQMRGYGMSEDPAYLEAAETEMTQVKQHLETAASLAKKAVYLEQLGPQVERATAAVKEYSGLMTDSQKAIAALNVQRSAMDVNAGLYMKSCAEFLAAQSEAFEKDLKDGQEQVRLIAEIVNRGTRTRVANFKAQASNDMKLMQEAVAEIKGRSKEVEALKKLTADSEDLKRLEEIDHAANNYSNAMEKYMKIYSTLSAANLAMDEAAAAFMKECSEYLEGQNKKMRNEFSESGADLEARLTKITIVNDIIDLGNAVRILNFKGQAMQELTLLEKAAESLGGLDGMLGKLRTLSSKEEDLRRIEQTDKAGKSYLQALKNFISAYSGISSIRQEMNQFAGTFVQQCASYMEHEQKNLGRDLLERNEKISLANDVVDLGNDTRVKAYKSQALRSPAIIEDAQKNFAKLEIKYGQLRKITRQAHDLEEIGNTQAAGEAYSEALGALLKEWLKLQDLGKRREETGKKVTDACMETADAGMGSTDRIATASAGSLSFGSTLMVIGLIIGTLIAIIFAVGITRSIVRALSDVISNLSQGSEQVSSASDQISQASQQLSSGASEQAASLEETSASLEQIASQTRNNAERVKDASRLAMDTNRAATTGSESMSRMSATIEKIRESSDATAKIVANIDEIAFQTNLLALNAAVEAARAGDAGKGFAVVADEVRNLAQRSAEAARNTAEMIEASQKNSIEGVKVSEEVSKALQEIRQSAEKVNTLVQEVSAASDEQAQGVDQVNKAVSQMDKVTQQNAASAEEAASSSEELNAQAQQLNAMVAGLVQMVGGAGQTSPQRSLANRPAARTLSSGSKGSERRALSSMPKAKTGPGGKAMSREEKLLPFNEDEFKDF